MKDNYSYLPEYANWLSQRVDEFVRYSLSQLPRFNIPMLEALKHLTEEQLFEISRESNIQLFKSMIEGNANEKALKDLEQLYADQNPLLKSDQISPEDVVRAYQLREVSFRYFLPDYTTDLNLALMIMEELIDLHANLKETAFKDFIRIKNKEIKVRNEILEDAQQLAKIGSWYYNMVSGKIFWSNEMYDIFEVPEDFPLNPENLNNFILEELREVARENQQIRLREKRTSFNTEYPVITGKGNRKYLAGRGRIIYDKNDKPVEMRGIYQDITEMHNAFKDLEKSQFILTEAQSIAGIGSWEYVISGEKLNWTLEHYRLFNIPFSKDVNWEIYFSKLHPEDVQAEKERLKHAITDSKGYESEFRLISDKGRITWIRSHVKVIINLTTGLADKLYGTSQDITDRIKAYEKIKKHQEKLAEAQRIAHIGSWEIDVITGKREWTDEHFRIFGYQPDDDISNEEMSSQIVEEDRELVIGCYNNALTNGEGYHIRYRIHRSENEIRWLSSTCHTEKDPATGKTIRIFGTTQDITQLVEKEIELQELNARLEHRVAERTRELLESNENLQHFAYIVSHDLKAPLRAIANIVTFIKADYNDILDESGREYLRLLDERTHFMESLIRNILEYSRAGGKQEEISEINMEELVKNIVHDLDFENSIDFDVQPLPVIMSKYTPVYQVLQNIILNAAKHVDPATGKISIGFTEKNDNLVFYISDNGPGIEKKHFENIFKIFQTLGGEKSGSGIGLAIVKKLMTTLGGEVWVESEPGSGSTFFFSLPSSVLVPSGTLKQ